MLNVISTCRDILCVDINVDKRCVDHSTKMDISCSGSKGTIGIVILILSATCGSRTALLIKIGLNPQVG